MVNRWNISNSSFLKLIPTVRIALTLYFIGSLWVEWQRLPTKGAVKATYFESDFGDPMLVIANTRAQAVIYTMDVLKGIFKPTLIQGLHIFA